MNRTFACHTICGGPSPDRVIRGQALVSRDPVCFYMIDAETGTIIEKGHDLEGQTITGKILVIPSGKGSSVVQDEGLFALKEKSTGPSAIVVAAPDTVLVAGALVMEFPIFDRVEPRFYEFLENGGDIDIRADKGEIYIHKSF
ncbi:MAG: DUF126 domain-containing protein [Desulfobacterales bacterium]|nr:DUF126 domain-containing protein [Desulfobacterales bacterium]